MVRGYLIAALLALGGSMVPATRLPLLTPKPPGTIVQDETAYLSGEGMSSRWRVISSKKLLGPMGHTQAYQWYLSIYAPPDGDVARLVYQSPGRSTLLARVQKMADAQMYFPFQSLKIVGMAELEHAAVQDVVVAFHETGADCGSANVAILGADQKMHVSVREQLVNYCSLDASIVNEGERAALRLSGPYYTERSPVCCPAKNKATALLRYRNLKWLVTPPFFAPEPVHRP